MGKNLNFHSDSRRITQVSITIAIVSVLGAGTLAMKAGQHQDTSFPKISKVDLSPIRGEFKPLRLHRGGFEYRCSECHRLFESPLTQEKRVAEHTDLVLDHGRNNYCFNCHHKTNRDVYTDHDGSEIPADEPAKLCAKCHGTIYRDWLVGAHGKVTGTWDSSGRDSARLLCIQCHDPHSPKFPALKPMPGPIQGDTHEAGGDL
jgi:hypothetical protein